MTSYDKRRIIRLYSDGKSYVIASQQVEEKLQIKLVNSAVCLNKINADEWQAMISKTNSVRSAGYSLMNESYGCLGLLSTSTSVSSSNDENADMQHCLLFVKDAISVGAIRKFEIMKITDVFLLPIFSDINSNVYAQQTTGSSNANSVNYFGDLKKFLSSGVFYFAYSSDPTVSFDLTLSSQSRNLSHLTNKKFLWNYNLHIPFRRLGVDTSQWLIKIICGCVEIKKVFTLSKQFKVCLFSRLSCERMGTRFQCRGLNDEGNCANFVETEQVLFSEDSDEESSFLQIRGSVPVFFEQTGFQVGNHRIKMSRGTDACYPAFDKHIKSLVHEYGTQLYILNLLGTKGDESVLTEFFETLCHESPFSMNKQLAYFNFDYHFEMKINKQALGERMWPGVVSNLYADNHKTKQTDGMFFYFRKETNATKLQTKFIRTNCMDCLDRTNNVQSYIGIEMLIYQLKDFLNDTETNKLREIRELYRQMWIINGDCISKIYAGTGAIQGKSVTQDISRSLTRAIQNNFLDSNKQDAIETFLFSMSRSYGDLADRVKILMSQNSLRLPHPVLRRMVSQYRDYTDQSKCRISIGTWNINGGFSPGDMEKVDLKEWLINGPLNAQKTGFGYLDPTASNLLNGEIDIFVVGFEEIVDLNAQNIVSASEEHALIWLKKLNSFLRVQGKYVPLFIDPLQLVGVCIFVFVLQKHVAHIRDVCVSKSKTGMGGNAGNKGGVLVRFIYYNTSMCFVCSHFAAHQKEIKQRNDDFRQIYENSEFVGQSVTSSATKLEVKQHDYVFWCGDLNYRIDLSNDRCRSLIGERDWDTLLENDQLSVQRKAQAVFRDFNEAPISFPPTYKYNIFEDSYDRSEKCRVPAWTDRVLWRRRPFTRKDIENKSFNTGKCLYYGRADIRYSDHRPVSALLEVEVNKVNPKKLIETLNRVILELHGPFQVVLIVNTHTNHMNEPIRNEIIDLFQKFNSFAMFRQYKKNLFITYSDGRYAYEAFAQLNNHHLVLSDLVIQVRVDNEQIYAKLIEQEVIDCLMSINMRNENENLGRFKENNISVNKTPQVEVGDLLGEGFSTNFDNEKSCLNVPSQMHSILSITDSMNTINNRLDSFLEEDDPRHQYHNPLIKALSNSNLTIYDTPLNADLISITNPFQNNTPKVAHSAANLLDATNDEIQHASLIAPPRRPPPPSVNSGLTQNFFEDSFEPKKPPVETMVKSNSFGFEDDFSLYPAAKWTTNSNQTMPPTRMPPPLPPFPSTSNFNERQTPENEKKPVFSLLDDPFESANPFNQSVSIVPTRPPPLPPMPTSTSNGKVPPPLPPMPSRNAVSKTQITKNNVDFLPLADLDLSSNNSNSITRNNVSNQTLIDFDMFNDLPNKPLPPPRPNHFK